MDSYNQISFVHTAIMDSLIADPGYRKPLTRECDEMTDQVGTQEYPTLDVLEARSGNKDVFSIIIAGDPCHR